MPGMGGFRPPSLHVKKLFRVCLVCFACYRNWYVVVSFTSYTPASFCLRVVYDAGLQGYICTVYVSNYFMYLYSPHGLHKTSKLQLHFLFVSVKINSISCSGRHAAWWAIALLGSQACVNMGPSYGGSIKRCTMSVCLSVRMACIICYYVICYCIWFFFCLSSCNLTVHVVAVKYNIHDYVCIFCPRAFITFNCF